MSPEAVKKIVLDVAKRPQRPEVLVKTVIERAKIKPAEPTVRNIVRQMIQAGELMLTRDRRVQAQPSTPPSAVEAAE
jgi:hypothetical protein